MQSSPLFFVMAIAFLLADSCDSNHVEIEALMAFKHNIFNGTHGVLANWQSIASNPCNWTGISCIPGTWRVNKLSLGGTDFTGHLVPALGNLTQLVHLKLSANKLDKEKFSDSVPAISSSYKLWSHAFVPVEVDPIILNFKEHELAFSQFYASEIGAYKAEFVYSPCYRNTRNSRLCSLPSWIGIHETPVQLQGLLSMPFQFTCTPWVSLNMLCLKAIKIGLVEVRYQREVNISRNQLRGSIPMSIGDVTSLESLDLSSNYREGRIPDELSRLHGLEMLDFSYNNLSGPIPKATASEDWVAESEIPERSEYFEESIERKHSKVNWRCNELGIIRSLKQLSGRPIP
eukprot:Gb_38335 [translate_table: standard]